MLAAIVPAVLYPGEISFINDEPRLLANAFHANQEGMLAPHGLKGNFEFTYGPVATHIYQFMQLFTRDPLTLASWRAGLCAGITALGLLWLARSLRLNPWFAVAIAFAPFLWVFHRIMWDASFAIPVGTICLAAYASFLRTRCWLSLTLAVFCGMLLPLIHPQDTLFAAPVALHMLFGNFRWLIGLFHEPRRLVLPVAGVAIAVGTVLWLNRAYFNHLEGELSQLTDARAKKQYPADASTSRAQSILAPFLSGRILGGHRYVENGWPWSGFGIVINTGKAAAYLIYPLIWLGVLIAVWGIVARRRPPDEGEPAGSSARGRDPENRASSLQARRAIAMIGLMTTAFQMVVFGLKRVPPEPQYFFGTFPAHVALAWLGVDWLLRVRVWIGDARAHAPSRILPLGLAGVWAIAIYGTATAVITLGSIYHFHFVVPGKDQLHPHHPEFPTLNRQIELVQALSKYDNTHAYCDVKFFQEFSQTIRSLRLIMPPPPDAQSKHAYGLLIRWSSGPHLEVIELSPGDPIPPDAKPIEVSPLHKGFQPRG